MHCPFCDHQETKVVDSRLTGEGSQVRRRRECLRCAERFTTFESPELVMPHLIKRDESRVPYDAVKLRTSFLRALEKRPVSTETVDVSLARIEHRLHTIGERELASRQIGEWVMEELRNIDQVAYVRYASVYRSFQDVNAFREEIDRLQQKSENRSDSERNQMSLLKED